MSKNKTLNKLGNTVKQKADDLVNDYKNKAKGKAIELFDECAATAKRKAYEFINDFANGTKEKAIDLVNKNIDEGTSYVSSKIDKQTKGDETIDEIEYLSRTEASPCAEQSDIHEVKESMSDEDDERFMNDITSEVLHTGVDSLVRGTDALSVVNNFAAIAGEVEKFREVQKTKRTAIEAEKQVVITKLHTQRDLFLKYLDVTFDERKNNFKKLFEVVDDAIMKGNTQQLAMGLNSINDLAKSSPFKDLASIDQVGKALEDKNHEWDF